MRHSRKKKYKMCYVPMQCGPDDRHVRAYMCNMSEWMKRSSPPNGFESMRQKWIQYAKNTATTEITMHPKRNLVHPLQFEVNELRRRINASDSKRKAIEAGVESSPVQPKRRASILELMAKSPECHQLPAIDSLDTAIEYLSRDPQPPRAMLTGRIVFTERRDPASKVLNVFLVSAEDEGPLHDLQSLTRDAPGELKRSNLKYLYSAAVFDVPIADQSFVDGCKVTATKVANIRNSARGG
ncbi:hypothetical protein DYB36_012737 [Aphanomyces astaci]|uniref:Uncharacterized protein n=1 Tax=Aphanomyces astaci TaxID=112090 RepID=A0A396ZYE3_APHAT|nr:hypothetical protein DYB36_012737 [Aphanomyces astaci]